MFELFSGIDPFPGSSGQIFKAKMLDKKPNMPPHFPSNLKDLIFQGWSKQPKERPQIQEFKSALNKMLRRERKKQSLTLQDVPFEEVDLAEKTDKELLATDAGDTFYVYYGLFIGCISNQYLVETRPKLTLNFLLLLFKDQIGISLLCLKKPSQS